MRENDIVGYTAANPEASLVGDTHSYVGDTHSYVTN